MTKRSDTPAIFLLAIFLAAFSLFPAEGVGTNSAPTYVGDTFVIGRTNQALSIDEDASGVMSFNSGGSQVAAISTQGFVGQKDVRTRTTATQLLVADSGACITNKGASAKVEVTLPSAVAGLVFTFLIEDTDGIKVIAATGDTLCVHGDISAAGGDSESFLVGDWIYFVATDSTAWLSNGFEGLWVVDGKTTSHSLRGPNTALTDGVPVTIATITISSGMGAGGTIEASIFSTNGTDHQVFTELVQWAAVNKAGTITSDINTSTGVTAKETSAGTISSSWTFVDNTDGTADILVSANTSLTPTTFTADFVMLNNLSNGISFP